MSNWDKTITTIPTYALISGSFQELAGMTSESGGRRIKPGVNIDMTSVRFLTSQVSGCSSKQARLLPHQPQEQELSSRNQWLSDAVSCPINGRHLTKPRHPAPIWMPTCRTHAGIRKGHDLMVRQLVPPTTDGLPLEIYCFTATTAWAAASMKGYRLIFSTTYLR